MFVIGVTLPLSVAIILLVATTFPHAAIAVAVFCGLVYLIVALSRLLYRLSGIPVLLKWLDRHDSRRHRWIDKDGNEVEAHLPDRR